VKLQCGKVNSKRKNRKRNGESERNGGGQEGTRGSDLRPIKSFPEFERKDRTGLSYSPST
jgi:hypothetical protein